MDQHIRQGPGHSSSGRGRQVLEKAADVRSQLLDDLAEGVLHLRRQERKDLLQLRIGFGHILLDLRIKLRKGPHEQHHLLKPPASQEIQAKDHQSQNPHDQDHGAVPPDDPYLFFQEPHQGIGDHGHHPADHKRYEETKKPRSPDTDQVDGHKGNRNV